MSGVGTATIDFGTGVAVTQDATKKWWLPATASEWKTLLRDTGKHLRRDGNIPVPKYSWLCQDASGSLVEAYGSGVDAGITGSPAPLYQQTISGWSRFGIKAPTDVTDIRIGATLGVQIAGKRPFFMLTIRRIDTTGAQRGLGGVQGVDTYKSYLEAGGNLGTSYTAGGGSASGLGAVSGDIMLGLLVNHSAKNVSQRAMLLSDQTRDLLGPSTTSLAELAGSPAVNLMGDPQNLMFTSDAALLYAAAWVQTGAITSANTVTIRDAYEIFRLIKSGPRFPFPGSNRTSVTVTGQTGITPTSHVEAWLQGSDATAGVFGHNEYEHSMVPITLRADNIVNNVGFDIVATSDLRLTGTFKVHWVWN